MAGRSQQQSANRRRKRPQPTVFGGLGSTYEDKDNDFVCPICFEMIEEAHMTKCGHSFCFKCISKSLEQSNRCPKCNFVIEKNDQIYPNFLLNELILKHKQKQSEQKRLRLEHQNGFGSSDLVEHDNLDLSKVNYLLDVLARKKQQLEGEDRATENCVLKEFLEQIRAKKQQQLDELKTDMRLITEDLENVNRRLQEHWKKYPHLSHSEGSLVNGFDPALASTSNQNNQEGFNGSKNIGRQWLNTTMASRRKKVTQHFEDLQQCYFTIRQKDLIDSSNSAASSDNMKGDTVGSTTDSSLDEFTESLSKFTRFSSCRPLATLNYASDIYNTSSIVSSIEFDRDCDYFAIAGVTKKKKVPTATLR